MTAKNYVSVFVVGAAFAGCVVDMDVVDESESEQAVLAPPTTVTVTSVTPERVNLSWSDVPGAIKYYVYKATDVAGPYVFANTARAPATSLQLAGLTPGQSYCFAVRSEDGGGPGDMSTPACTSTTDEPTAPDTVIAYPLDATSIDVDWSEAPNAYKYYVYRADALNGSYTFLRTEFAPKTSFIQTGLTAGATYCYKVAVDIGGYISPQSLGHCNTSFQPPRDVTATRASTTRINVAWAAATDATKYYVYESRGGAPYQFATTVVQSATPGVQRANLTTGTEYCYRIVSVNASNQQSPRSLPPTCATP
jgi:fibronectin type 3 domain-containing protein